jgi:hypothetical protein
MNQSTCTYLIVLISIIGFQHSTCAQNNPAITQWILNTNGTTGSHYINGNGTAIEDNIEVNVQAVSYSNSWVYVTTNGIPAYPTGPFLDGNPSLAQDQNAIFKFPLTPAENIGVPTPTTGGNIGVFINGVALFDYRDGVSWNNNTGAEGGGPIPGPPGQGIWNRDAIVAERDGFDCAKGHPAMGNYHHHQNPSAFDLDLQVLSDICSVYASDGLYAIDPNEHSPLIGFAYDGFPIYGAYGFANADGSGGIERIRSSYQLRAITERTHYADGTDVTDGPDVNANYPLGHYREDYEFVAHAEAIFLDEHNGRFCVTPEYPDGIYAYFCTVDENWNSAYPYAVGPTFYGNKVAVKVNAITENVTNYNPDNAVTESLDIELDVLCFPNPANEYVAIQYSGLLTNDLIVQLFDVKGSLIKTTKIKAGSTITFMDVRDVYAGEYILRCGSHQNATAVRVMIN